MILVDSFGWIEFFTDGPLADKYYKYLKDESRVITPTIVLYEVYKKIKHERSEEEALIAVAQLNKTKVLPLNESIALFAADLSLKHALPMADAVVYATACLENADVVTSDSHFEGLSGVVFLKI